MSGFWTLTVQILFDSVLKLFIIQDSEWTPDEINHVEHPEKLRALSNQGHLKEEPQTLGSDVEDSDIVQYKYETPGCESTLFVDIQEYDERQDSVTLHFDDVDHDDNQEHGHEEEQFEDFDQVIFETFSA